MSSIKESLDDDFMLPSADFPLQARYFPLGFPLQISSNSPKVMAAAAASWEVFAPTFQCLPLEIHLGVTDDAADSCEFPPAPVFRLQSEQLVSIANANNFIVSDLRIGRSFGWITPNVADSPLYLRYHLLEAAVLSMITALYALPLHAACVSWDGIGILLCGDSGAGKSSLAYAASRAGWTFISDDASYMPLNRDDRMVIGNSHQVRFRDSGVVLFPELEGRPITPRAAGKPSIEVATSELGVTTAITSFVNYIVFLNRTEVFRHELVPLSRQSVMPWFKKFLMTTSASRSAHESALERLLEAKVFELHYRDLEWAIETLRNLAQYGDG